MKIVKLPQRCLWLLALMLEAWPVAGQVVLNEILFNPPGTPDAPNEYIELRGTPNYLLPQGTYLVSVDGDLENNPGKIDNVFDLSGHLIGGNGFLVLLQKTNSYAVNPKATLLENTNSGSGWGSGNSSSIGHRGDSGQTELFNPSITFFLVRSAVPPVPGNDVDSNNNGLLDGTATNWVILDSVGILDNTGAGDFAYGSINFRRSDPPGNGATASGLIVSVNFTPKYVGRSGNTSGSTAADWVASNDLQGTAPNWSLHATDTAPSSFAGRLLNHLGSPNFGASALNGVLLRLSDGWTELAEGDSNTDAYTLALNTRPAGAVMIEARAAPQVQISTDNGVSYGASRSLTFTSTNTQTVLVRALDDNIVDTAVHPVPITHRITSTGDPTRYPTNSLIPTVNVPVRENDWLLLTELKVNPPGPEDAPYEYVEIKGPPDALLTNVYLLALDGKATGDPGKTDLAADLSGTRLGSQGLLLVVADGHPYTIPFGTEVFLEPGLSAPGGSLGNNSASFLLVTSPQPILTGEDLDNGDNGILEGLPDGTTILDAVGWRANATNDIVYGGVSLTDGPGTPDAAMRFPGNNTPRSAAAWFYGDLAGTDGTSLTFDEDHVSPNFPSGTPLSPGFANNTAPLISGLRPLSAAIGDPTNLRLTFTIGDLETPVGGLTLTLASSNPAVIPDSNLLLSGGNGTYTLTLDPVGVGYSLITITVSDGAMLGVGSFLYAVSERCSPATRFHTGVSDASTAIPLDANYMLVGDDENQVLRIYSRSNSGPPIVGMDFTPYLGLTDYESGIPREVDIESSTRAGDRIYWMGGHSHASIAEGRTNRSRIFTTAIAGAGTNTTLTYLGRYDFLKLDLVDWDANNQHGKGANYYGLAASSEEGVNPKAPDGFNIEGLTMAPNSSDVAYVAFRAPIVPATNRTCALIVPVLNFNSLASGTGPPGSAVFGTPIELDLYGRGIRSIERQGTNYLIVAGPPGDLTGLYPNDFRLYTWTGFPSDAPQMRDTDLSGLGPEGIVELPPGPWATNTPIQLLSDCGRKIWYNDGIPAKKLRELAFKKFRSDWVVLGAPINPDPIITDIQVSELGATIWWRAFKGLSYRVQVKAALDATGWTDLPGDVVATGQSAFKLDTPRANSQRFYRVKTLP